MDKPLILVIDDEPKQTDMIAKMINGTEKYEAIKAYNAKEGFDALNKHKQFMGIGGNRIKCIILDIKMPEMDGLEFLKELRKHESFTQLIPVIILTAYEDKDKWTKAASPERGLAVAYIKKPIKEEELLPVIDRCVAGEELGKMIDETREKKYQKLEEFKKEEETKKPETEP